MKKKKLKVVIGGILIVVVLIGIFISVGSENMTYYYTPGEVMTNPLKFGNDKIRVMGFVKENSIRWEPENTQLDFVISDDAQNTMSVRYHGAKPDMFREGQGVVVEGRLEEDRLAASALLVKHNEDYKVTEHSGSKESYLKTME